MVVLSLPVKGNPSLVGSTQPSRSIEEANPERNGIGLVARCLNRHCVLEDTVLQTILGPFRWTKVNVLTLPPVQLLLGGSVLLDLEPSPAHTRDHRWNVLAWNRAESVVADWEAYPAVERNIVWHHFAHPSLRRLMVNWEREARTLLALFRMESGLHLDDPWFTILIDRLQQVSSEFRHWWSLHEVQQQRELPIEFHHPDVGRLVLQPVTVVFVYDQHLFLRVLMPLSAADTAAKLRQLMQEGGAKQREGDQREDASS